NSKNSERIHSKTHITTNLNAEELETRYGSRVRSRLREMFNLIGFDESTKDKRQ
ncbi:MAG: ATPase, partial [Gelidibacter sp.]|nr:ATPase [Gelidibacter sp.]